MDANSEKAGTGMNKYTIVCALLASTNSILLGYDIGVMSGAVLCIKENLKITSTQVEILALHYSLSRMHITNTCTPHGPSHILPIPLAGRAVAGIGVGYALMIAPVYTAELSPAMSRGFLTSLPEVFITFGLLVGYIVNYALSGLPPNMNWRLMLGLAAVPAVGIGLGVIAMPESPRWLVMKGKLSEAKQVLIRTSASEEEAQLRLEEISKAALALPPSTSSLTAHEDGRGHGRRFLVHPSKPIRRMLIAAIGINFFMQASGNDAVVYYCPEVFKAAGIHSRKQLFGVNVIMGLAKTSFVPLGQLLGQLWEAAPFATRLCRDGDFVSWAGPWVKVSRAFEYQANVGHCDYVSWLFAPMSRSFQLGLANNLGLLIGDLPDEITGPRFELSHISEPFGERGGVNDVSNPF
ncbi:polyol/monosaccharide transporter 5 [Prunus dulcis]|uniref:Polyol/monosaccharide transporter 5 n=1 Tax=Prunus dulcis TaxID=3755 RepID=A0A4Y1RVM5_PRUDU|nr:polyol/monosaccharide transporter 5 [Prunus dulcis]